LKVRGGANGYLGGVIGYSETPNNYLHSNIENNVNVTGDLSTYTGGLIGYSKNQIVLDNFINNGNINSNNSYVGGLIGYAASNTTISNAYNNGEVSGDVLVGGLVGANNITISITSTVIIMNSYNSGKVSGKTRVAGLVGQASNVYIYYSINFGNVSSSSNKMEIGGLVGTKNELINILVEDSYYTGTIKVNEVEVDGIDAGIKIHSNSIDEKFFLETVSWDKYIWNLDDVDISNEIYPSLK